MKLIVLLLVVFAGIFYLFGWEEKERVETNQAISVSPAFTPAKVDGVTKTTGKRSETYRVHFKYEVNGVTYRTSTSSTDAEGVRRYVSEPNAEVAYDSRNPSTATLKRYYDLRDEQETVGRALFLGGILSFGMALPIAFGIAWPLRWLRRRKKSTGSDAS